MFNIKRMIKSIALSPINGILCHILQIIFSNLTLAWENIYDPIIKCLGFLGSTSGKKKICQPTQLTQETQVQSLGQDNPLKWEMAPHSSILAWKIPWAEKSGGLWSMGPQIVRHV